MSQGVKVTFYEPFGPSPLRPRVDFIPSPSGAIAHSYDNNGDQVAAVGLTVEQYRECRDLFPNVVAMRQYVAERA